MSIKIKHGDGPNLRPKKKSDFPNSSLSLEGGLVLVSGSYNSLVTLGDALFDQYTSSSYYFSGNLKFTNSMGLESLNPEIATISKDGLVSRVSDGICRVISRGNITLGIDIDLRTKAEVLPINVYNGVLTGSLAEHISAHVDDRIDNTMTMTTNGKVFTTQDHSTPSYTRNSNLWCNQGTPIDLTCISPWNSRDANKRAGTLITSRHVLNAAHYPLYNGDTIRFIASDNTIHTRTITGSVNHPSYSPHYPDLRLYTLDSDLPAAISPCKMMPSNNGSYLVNNTDNRPAALLLDQEEKVLIGDWKGGGGYYYPVDTDRLIFSEVIISGDSGNPSFLIVNDELVLVTCWTGGGAGSGTPVADFIDDINTMIITSDAQSAANTGYTVTEADFSAFPSY